MFHCGTGELYIPQRDCSIHPIESIISIYEKNAVTRIIIKEIHHSMDCRFHTNWMPGTQLQRAHSFLHFLASHRHDSFANDAPYHLADTNWPQSRALVNCDPTIGE